MQRDVTDAENTTWSCAQAYAGLGDSPAARAAAERAADAPGAVAVVCTPSGGAQSVRLELPANWAGDLSDDDLLAAIAGGHEGAARG